jgi:membrane protein YqaA with SNARE-associated domain
VIVLFWSVMGASIGSALLPLINIEAILALAVSQEPDQAVVLVVAATIGQMVGKLAWYWGGANLDRATWVHRHLEKPKPKAALAKWHERAEGRPLFTAGLLFVSAFVGLPPYAVTAVLAGVLRVNFAVFLLTGLLGRGLRFWLVVEGVHSLLELW